MKNSILHKQLVQTVTERFGRFLHRMGGIATPLLFGVWIGVGATASAASLTLGSTINGQLSTPGQADQYTFNGTPGMRLAYDALSSDSVSINAQLLDPSGNAIFNVNSRSDVAPFVLLDTGTYTLTLKGNGATTGSYSFRLVDLSAVPALPLGTIITKTQTPGTLADYYILNATAGQNYYFDGLGSDNQAGWALYAPNNAVVSSANVVGDFQTANLTQTGAYILAILPASQNPQLTYSVRVASFTISTNPLTLSAVTKGTISTAGEIKVYTFSGTPGQRIAYDAQDSDQVSINARLLTPGGVVLFDQNSRNDSAPLTLPELGTYSLLFYGNGATIGSFTFRLVDLLSQPLVDTDFSTPVTSTLNPGTAAAFYTVAGLSGEQLYFDAQGANSPASWYLYTPNNVQLTGANIATDFEVTLPRDGTFILALYGNSAQPVPYTFRVLPESVPSAPLTLGATITGSLVNPGDQHTYTFNGIAGQRIYYDSLNRQFGQISSRLVGPNGQVIWDFNNASYDRDPYELTASGTYTLTIDGISGGTGAFAFRILDLSSAQALAFGNVTAGQLNPSSSTTIYQFNGTSGQRLNFKTISASVNQAGWRLIGPAMQVIASTQIAADLGDVVLPSAGPYWLLIEGTQDNSAPLSYQFLATDHSEAPVAVTNLGATRSGTIAGGQQDTLTFTAPAGLVVYFDSMDRTANSSGLVADLHDPNNTLVFSIGAGSDSIPYVLPHSGTYTLVIRGGSASATGTFKYRLMNWTGDAMPLTLNQTVTSSLDPAYRTDVYFFDGQPGQRLIYDALDTTSDNISVRLYGPDLQVRFINGSSHTDIAPFTLTLAGRYYLVFESNVAAPAQYTGRLLDVAAQPDLPLAAPFTANVSPGVAIIAYKFSASAGQRFSFSGQGGTGIGSFYIYGPNNEPITGLGSFTGYTELTAANPGTYAFLIYGANPGGTAFTATIGAFNQTAQPTSDLTITGIENDLGSPLITWSSSAGKSYRVSYKNNLEDLNWIDLAGDVTATGSSAQKEDGTVGNAKRRFYRLEQLP